MTELRNEILLSDLAGQYARKYHEGQVRKRGSLPYVVHPACVVALLQSFGVKDEITKSMAWLHDTLEDTTLSFEEIESVFGLEVALGVKTLTRDVDNDLYKSRLATADANIQKVKLCDIIDNSRTMHVYSLQGIKKKIADYKSFYIPLARKLDPRMAEAIESNIQNYC